jgi:glycine dehydrogenase subunit 2
VIARVCEEAYADAAMVKAAPHNQAIRQLRGDALEDPARWAMTWRAFLRKRSRERVGGVGEAAA